MLTNLYLYFTGLQISRQSGKTLTSIAANEEPSTFSLPNKHLLELNNIMPKYLLASRSENTTKKYDYYFNKWDQFITKKGGSSIPAKDIHVALYFTYMLESKSSYNTINTSYCAIKWKNEINGYSYEAGPYVSNILKASKRMPKASVNRKDPVNSDIIINIIETFGQSKDLAVIRDLTLMLICYTGFLRYDEASQLKFSDIKFKDDHMSVYIRKSKTDQFRDGKELLIAKGKTIACPVEMIKKYFSIANLKEGEDFIFRPLYRNKDICKLVSKNKPLSYTRARECILSRIKNVPSVNKLNIGMHSFRSGGATQAANSDVNERCWMRHGRWATDGSKNRYIEDSTEKRLSVSKSLGL